VKRFSVLDRRAWLEEVKNNHFDLVIIGGGITGAGILLDATTRGLKCVLFEKSDFASGTSSRSTKLIHGGLRYLKQLEFGLVHESGTERALIHNNAPHVVLPEDMLLPIYKEGSLGELTTSLGLKVYDFLAGVDKREKRKMLKVKKVKKMEPLLKAEGLTGGGIYKEYRTDDARLVIEIIKKAVQYNSKAFNYAKVNNFVYKDGQVVGVKVKDEIFDDEFTVNARCIINAAGPWVDDLRYKDNEMGEQKLQLTKGVHLVVPFEKLPIQQSIYFDVADGRMIFAIPRDQITYVGTTDTFYEKVKEEPEVSEADINYLLAAVNDMFPTVKLVKNDIESTWAGLRPLIHKEGKGPSELSRKDEIFISESNLISIAGGKLTGYRKMAERAVDQAAELLQEKYNLQFEPCITKQIKLAGGDFKHPKDIHLLNADLQKIFQHKIPNVRIHQLIFRYGSNAPAIFKKIENEVSEENLWLAELDYALHFEMVSNLSDFFIRRTGMGYFEKPKIKDWLSITKNQIESLLDEFKPHIAKDVVGLNEILAS